MTFFSESNFFLGKYWRLRGITKSISRYPTFRRRFEALTKLLLENIGKKSGKEYSNNGFGFGSGSAPRTRSSIVRFLSEKSFKRNKSDNSSDSDSRNPFDKDIEIQWFGNYGSSSCI